MTIRIALSHQTEYHFDKLVSLAPHVIRLRPAPHCRTPIQSYSLRIKPDQHFVNWQQDPFGNYLARFVFPEKSRHLAISVELVADMTVINPFDFFLEEDAEKFPIRYDDQLRRDLGPYLEVSENGKLLQKWMSGIDISERPIVDFLVDVNQQLMQKVDYLLRMEAGVQSCEQTLRNASGSCRDSAWLLVQILRRLGLAARFVSGYLVQLKSDVEALDGPSGPEADFTDLHAWTEVFLPGAGWVGLDPTSGLFAGEGHIPLACTPEPSSAAPVTGATDPCQTTFEFSNSVSRIFEDPRVTKPYSDGQWKKIVTLGNATDRKLKAGDLRLTQGGEPTFVSIDDMESAQWNSDALGDDKLRLANDLLDRLRQRYAADGLLHIGQGKWYPGEPLPRWALSLYWRTDGHPLWRKQEWLDDGRQPRKFETKHAERLINRLAASLGVGKEFIVPGYEDLLHYLHEEGRLPENIDPADERLTGLTGRKRMREVLGQGLGEVVGYALPLKYQPRGKSGYWKSSAWPFRAGHMFLTPGDSPMGYRLPIDSLPWQLPEEREAEPEADPFAQRDALPRGRRRKTEEDSQRDDDREILHTALCVQVRKGRLHLFLPPVSKLEQFIELLQAIESAALQSKTPIVIEGYPAPRDPRLRLLQVTPDPGVIEVNVQPAASWRDLISITETLYEDARLTRLGTEKFMLDGRHSGTGGGNHVTLGAASAEDSPFLRRPHLLRSLITYWQRHPALSYLFSGMFIGPTSQAPRVDEARDDNLYELEIAFDQLPEGDSDQPWLVDRILRNFLVDLTGNTHRAEFCIDKLYAPQTATGRLGLVEFRGFEMPPHPQMALVQMLLLRALVAQFWEHPYRSSLKRWGTELHDRFMLRHFVWEDLKRVVDDLQKSGFGFELAWFEPFLEFRFPRVGSLLADGMQLDLHMALEPWHVLGEESSGQGTSRYVDSSVERLQVSLRGLDSDRYAVCCNGRRLPLRAVGPEHYIAGVRYKAWQPWSALHPTIDAHPPLVFDIVDIVNRRSIAGCTYHVAHPGGRNYETYPVNANEAEARRSARFFTTGASQGDFDLPPVEFHPEQAWSLDLRRHSQSKQG